MASLKLLVGLLIVVFFVHIFATVNFWYWTTWWLDLPMHFLGGFTVAVFVFWVSGRAGFPVFSGRPQDVFLVLGAAALAGVLWEFLEFGYDVFVSSRGYLGYLKAQLSGADTMADLFFDLFGALFGFILKGIRFRR